MAFSLQLEATLRRPHLDGRLSGPVFHWTWAGGNAGKELIYPEQGLAHQATVRRAIARSAETFPGLGQWAEEGREDPQALVQGSVIGKNRLCRPAPRGLCRPGVQVGGGLSAPPEPGVLLPQDASGRPGADRFVGHIFEPLPLPF